VAIAYNASTSIFGGTAPVLNSWAIGISGNTMIPAYTMMAACVVGLAALPFLRETAGKPLAGFHVPGN
jgi:hypothetical protein